MRIAMSVGNLKPGEVREFVTTEGKNPHSCQPPNPEEYSKRERGEYEGTVNLKEKMKAMVEEAALEDVTKPAQKIALQVLADNVQLFDGVLLIPCHIRLRA